MLKFQIATGDLYWLWRDPWHLTCRLEIHFPRAPVITGLSYDSKLSFIILQGDWSWPSQSDPDIMTIMVDLPPISDGVDFILWKSGHFSTSSAYNFFNYSTEKVAWFALLHDPLKIPRNQFILWLAILDKLSTGVKVWLNTFPSSCCLCNSAALETRSHLFFECSFSRCCLHILRGRVKFLWPFVNWNSGIKWAMARYRGKHLISTAYRATLAFLVYHIWKERNSRRFSNISSTLEEVSHLVEDQIRLRTISEELESNLQVLTLFRLWKVASS
ncbi:UNVERIFIED_CONTAM: hypothetical protein Slati_4178100 [Sesamum latifolium]|uniref:Reverse transcriptase zinc-binding domain-containing protein n=1 Tax=Sesamum latifolium TaxID=2727402 RepID=A0AAW2TB38_9LAMI